MCIEQKTCAHFTEEDAKAPVGAGFTLRSQVRTRNRSWSLCPQPSGFSGRCLGLVYSPHSEMS